VLLFPYGNKLFDAPAIAVLLFPLGSKTMAGTTDLITALALAKSRAGVSAQRPPDGLPASTTVSSAEQLGRMVAQRRKALKLNQQNFADLAGVGRRFVSDLEGGKPTVEFAKTLQVLQALGIDLVATSRS
jgi:y4mF family transcriptional regulator